MAKTSFSGPIKVGTIKSGTGANAGTPTLAQKVYFVPTASIVNSVGEDGTTLATYNGSPAVAWAATAAAATASFGIPANASIVDIIIDQPVVTTGGTAINLTSGISAAGVEYVASTDVKATVRLRPTYTAAHLIAMANIGANNSVFVQVTPTVAAVTAGVLSVTFLYTQV